MNREECRERILSQDYRDFLVPFYRGEETLNVQTEDACVQNADFGYRVIYADHTVLEPLNYSNYWYNSIPNCYSLLDMEALNTAGISAVQNYPTLQLMGSQIMIGFVDTGIDYRNSVFRNIDGSTRIAGIWDQTIQTGVLPENLDYGSEYTEDMINEALLAEDPLNVVPSMDEDGHGTFLASVAAGSADVPNRFLGAAPEASIGVVKLKTAKNYLKEFYAVRQDAVCFQENDIMLGMKYLNQLANKKNMPLVICVALGTNFGGHNGTTLLSSMIDIYASILNLSVVIGTGNEAVQRHHYYHQFQSMNEQTDVELRVGSGVGAFAAELWTTLPNVMTISITSPTGERTGHISLRQGYTYSVNFIFDKTEVNVEYRLLLENNDSQLIFLRFRNPSAGIWTINVEPVQMLEGEFHIWLPVEEFLAGEVYFLEANPDTTLTEPGTSRNAMTVAYYNGRENGVDINSGRGYTRDGLIKPDYAVPGVEVTGAGLNGSFVTRTGSSVATGIAAGAAALLMEWILEQPEARGVNSSQIRNIILLGTDQRAMVEYPNREWGYGTMNLFQSLDTLRRLK